MTHRSLSAFLFLPFVAMLAACTHADPIAQTCPDPDRVATCNNWVPDSIPYCYSDGPGPAPFPNCAGMGTPDRFDAPVAVTDGDGGWDWWCCPLQSDGGLVEGGVQ